MPGLTIITSTGNPFDRSRLSASESAIRFLDDSVVNHFHDTPDLYMAASGYANYPVSFFEDDSLLFLFEGMIYNKELSVVQKELREIGKGLFRNGVQNREDSCFEHIKQFITENDGDFIVLIVDKNSGNQGVVFNDALGRLPLYFAFTGNFHCISREIRFIRTFLGHVTSDERGFSEGLLLGYPLEARTYFKEISKMPPGSLCKFGTDEKTCRFIPLFSIDFDDVAVQDMQHESSDHTVRNLADIFIESCRQRAGTHEHSVLSLSGGLGELLQQGFKGVARHSLRSRFWMLHHVRTGMS